MLEKNFETMSFYEFKELIDNDIKNIEIFINDKKTKDSFEYDLIKEKLENLKSIKVPSIEEYESMSEEIRKRELNFMKFLYKCENENLIY